MNRVVGAPARHLLLVCTDCSSELALQQNATVDQIVSLALAAQVSAWRTRESIESRANRVDWQKVDDILARVPDAPPQPGDEL